MSNKDMKTKEKINDNEIKKMTKAIAKLLKEKHHPYIEIVITQDGVKIKEIQRSIPIEF